jgi:hypothetical protein
MRFVRLKSKSHSGHRLAWTYLLLLGFTIFLLSADYSINGIVDHSRFPVTEKSKPRVTDSFRGKHNQSGDLPFIISASSLSFGFSLSLLKFDFKQNLRTWPVLGTGIQRSPPWA